MASWKQPELPPMETLPPKRAGSVQGKIGGRIVAAVAGLSFVVGSLVALRNALSAGLAAGGGRSNAFGALAMLIPAVMLLRYAWTGRVKAA